MLDRARLAQAIGDADLVVLWSTIAHLTGDVSLLDRYRLDAFDRGRRPTTLSSDEIDEIRTIGVDRLTSIDVDRVREQEVVADDVLRRIMSFCAGEDVSPDYVPLVIEESSFDVVDRRRFMWHRPPTADELRDFHVVIIGAGFGGIGAAIRLEEAGIPFTVFDKNADIGGTWFENTYPDLRVDVPNHFYSYSFATNPDWSDYYARQAELVAYITRCANDHGVASRVQLETEVVAADYDGSRAHWRVTVRDSGGSERIVEANAIISAVGMLNRPSVPDIEGLDTFDGPCFHSSRWDHAIDLRDRRVAVVGTGASAMQFAPAIAPDVDQLSIFQRSRHWVTVNPNYHRPVSDDQRWLFRHVPFYAGWYRFLQFWNNGDRMYPAFRVDPNWETPDISISLDNEKLRRVMVRHLQTELADTPELIDQVTPDYPALGKRILQDNGWFRMLQRENVALIHDRIARVTAKQVITEAGDSHDVDAIVLATGFHPNKFLWPMDITARGQRLQDLWGENPRAYLGITIPGFPNLFCLYGPNTNPVVGSVIFMLECQINYAVRSIGAMIEGGITSMECRQDVHDRYNALVDAEHEQMIWRHPKVHSYYNNREGRVTTNAPWRLIDYWKMTKQPNLDDYVLSHGSTDGERS